MNQRINQVFLERLIQQLICDWSVSSGPEVSLVDAENSNRLLTNHRLTCASSDLQQIF